MLVCSSGVLVFISGLWFVSVVEVLLHVVESGFLPSVVVFCVCPLLHPVVTFPYEPYYAGSSFAHTLAFGRSLARDVAAGSVQGVRGYSSVLSCTACRRWCVLCGSLSSYTWARINRAAWLGAMAAVLPVAHEGGCILVASVLCGVGVAVMLLGVRLRRRPNSYTYLGVWVWLLVEFVSIVTHVAVCVWCSEVCSCWCSVLANLETHSVCRRAVCVCCG